MTPTLSNSSELRCEHRTRIPCTTKVIDVMTQQTVGRLGNLSPGGLMVIGPCAPHEHAIYQFRLELLTGGTATHLIEVGVCALWHRKAARPGQVWAGYATIAMADSDFRLLRAWLAVPA